MNDVVGKIVFNRELFICGNKVIRREISHDIILNQDTLDLTDNNKQVWNSAIDTMMEVIELQPLIDQSTKDRIKEIAKGLKK